MTENFSDSLSLRKMAVELAEPVQYFLDAPGSKININNWLGLKVKLTFEGLIGCIYCDRQTKKSFNQGYCYPCFQRLARCDACIVSPEKCHYAAGTCREPEWGEQHCMRKHYVYLANSSGVKVGITRAENIPSRWIDQGAVQALPILAVDSRLHSGLAEVMFKQHVADKTNWRAMLKGEVADLSLAESRDRLLEDCAADLQEIGERIGIQAIQTLPQAEQVEISYPVLEYPVKVVSHNLDKNPVVEGVLQGIKGQYLILDTGVINIRKYAGYHVNIDVTQ